MMMMMEKRESRGRIGWMYAWMDRWRVREGRKEGRMEREEK